MAKTSLIYLLDIHIDGVSECLFDIYIS